MGFLNRLNAKLKAENERLKRQNQAIQDSIDQTRRDMAEIKAIEDEGKKAEEEFSRNLSKLIDAKDFDGIEALLEKSKKETEARIEKLSRFRF